MVGTSASIGAHSRKAAQSARNTAKNTPKHAASRNPGCGGVGATTSWNADHDVSRARRAAETVSGVGMSSRVVLRKKSQLVSRANPNTESTAVIHRLSPLRRARTSARWVTRAVAASGPRKSQPVKMRVNPKTTLTVTSVSHRSAVGWWVGVASMRRASGRDGPGTSPLGLGGLRDGVAVAVMAVPPLRVPTARCEPRSPSPSGRPPRLGRWPGRRRWSGHSTTAPPCGPDR